MRAHASLGLWAQECLCDRDTCTHGGDRGVVCVRICVGKERRDSRTIVVPFQNGPRWSYLLAEQTRTLNVAVGKTSSRAK